MATLAQALTTLRRLGMTAAAGVLASGMVLVVAPPGASAVTVIAVDCSTTNLQDAINSADPGATMTVTGTCFGHYTIDTNLTLSGQGSAVLDGQKNGPTLTISSAATVRVTNLTITDGNAGTGSGGGINNSGTLSLEESTVSNNIAGNGGGGINNSGVLTVKDTTVSGNSGLIFGGGIYNNNAMTLEGVTVSDNTAFYGGGGILTGFGFAPVTVKDSTISDNTTSGTGAGIFNIADSETVKDTTVSGNTAAFAGGGFTNEFGTTTLENSSVTNNAANVAQLDYVGGGIFNFSGSVALFDSIVSSNSPDNCSSSVTGCTG